MNHARNEALRPQEIVQVSPAKAEVQQHSRSVWAKLRGLFVADQPNAQTKAPEAPSQTYALDANHSITLPPAYDANPPGKKDVERAMNPNYRIDAVLTMPNQYPNQKNPGKTLDLKFPLQRSDNVSIWQEGLPTLRDMNVLATQWHQYNEELSRREVANDEEIKQLQHDEKAASSSLKRTDETSERGKAIVARLQSMRNRLEFLSEQQAFLKQKAKEMMNQHFVVTKRHTKVKPGDPVPMARVTITHILDEAAKDMAEFKTMAVSIASKNDSNPTVSRAYMRDMLTYWYTNKPALKGLAAPDFKALLQSTPMVAGPVEGDLDDLFAEEDARQAH